MHIIFIFVAICTCLHIPPEMSIRYMTRSALKIGEETRQRVQERIGPLIAHSLP
jgi:hypothetical protein